MIKPFNLCVCVRVCVRVCVCLCVCVHVCVYAPFRLLILEIVRFGGARSLGLPNRERRISRGVMLLVLRLGVEALLLGVLVVESALTRGVWLSVP